MVEVVKRTPPLPVVQSFLTCQEIFSNPKGGRTLLLGPLTHVPVTQFPAHVQLSIYADFTGGHGSYQPQLSLYDEAEEAAWSWTPPGLFKHSNPLLPCHAYFNDLILDVPQPGRYRLVLFLNDEQAAQRTLWFGPQEAFQLPDAM